MIPPSLDVRLDPAIAPAISPILLAELESGPQTAIVVDFGLRIRYLNPGWYAFMELTGQEAKQRIGDFFCAGFLEPEQSRHTRALMDCLEFDKGWTHLCECACEDAYRLFRLDVEVLADRAGLILRYPLVRELALRPHPAPVKTEHFLNRFGIAQQCPQCKRFMSEASKKWAWLQDWIIESPPYQSRVFCPVCVENYHPGG